MRRWLSAVALIGLASTADAQVLITPIATGGSGSVTGGNCSAGQVVTGIGPTGVPVCAAGGTGDVTGPASSADNQFMIASGTGGKTLKLFTSSGLLKFTSGVATAVSLAGDTSKFFNENGAFSVLPQGLDRVTITGPSTARSFAFPDANATIVYQGGGLGTPSSGTLTSATGLPVTTGISGMGTGVGTFLATPSGANLLSALTTKSGTGVPVFTTSPTLITPVLGVATGTSLSLSGLGGSGAKCVTTDNAGALGLATDACNPSTMIFGSITGSTTLVAADCGSIYLMTGTSADYAVNLPNAPTDGCSFVFKSGSTTALTKLVAITRQGSDLIEWPTGTVTSFAMWAGEYCGLAYKSSIATWEKVGCQFIGMKSASELRSTQSVTPVTGVQVLLDTNLIDVGSMWRSGSNDFLVRRTGTYFLEALISGVFDATEQLHTLVFKNTVSGTRLIRRIDTASGAAQELTPETSGLVSLTAGDTIQLITWQTAGGSVSIPSDTTVAPCRLSIYELIP